MIRLLVLFSAFAVFMAASAPVSAQNVKKADTRPSAMKAETKAMKAEKKEKADEAGDEHARGIKGIMEDITALRELAAQQKKKDRPGVSRKITAIADSLEKRMAGMEKRAAGMEKRAGTWDRERESGRDEKTSRVEKRDSDMGHDEKAGHDKDEDHEKDGGHDEKKGHDKD